MTSQGSSPRRPPSPSRAHTGRSSTVPSALRTRRAIVFGVSFALVAYLALRGGAYDAVVRQELGLVLWAALALGLATGIVPRADLRGVTLLPLALIGGLAALTLLSLAWSPSAERTFSELARVVLYGGILATPALALNRYTWRAAAGGIVGAALAVSAFAVATRLAPATLPFDRVAEFFSTDRLSYPLDYWNAVAAWGAIAATAGLAWSAHTRVAWARAACVGLVPAAVLCVYLTYSRAGTIGLIVGAAAVLALSANRWTVAAHTVVVAAASAVAIAVVRGEPAIADATGGAGGQRVALALLAGMVVCAAVGLLGAGSRLDHFRLGPGTGRRAVAAAAAAGLAIGLLAGGAGALGEAWEQFQDERTTVVSDDPAARLTTAGGTRSEVWDAALDAFRSEPLAGIGPGTFELYWNQNASVPEYMRDAHSLYLESLAELGVPGLLLILGVLGSALWLGIRTCLTAERSSERAAATAMAAAAIVFAVVAGVDWMWEETAVTVLGLGSLGVLLAGGRDRRAPGLRGPAPRVLVTSFAVLAALSQVPGLVSEARVRESSEALSAGREAEAGALAGDAVEAEPWASTPHMLSAAVATARGDFRQARTSVERAIANDPEDWRPRLALVQIELARGDRDAARQGFEAVPGLSLPAAVPYEEFAPLARDRALLAAARGGCLAFAFGACDLDTKLFGRADCRTDTDRAVTTIEVVHGVRLDQAAAIKSSAGGETLYYVAGLVDGELTTWVVDAAAYRAEGQFSIALDRAAISASSQPDALGADALGVSGGDEGARVARACAEGP